MVRRLRTATAGQASIEWVTTVAVVTALLGGTGAALAQAGFVGRSVTRGVARAICVVGAGDCERDREPCTVSASGDRSSWGASFAILRLGHDRLALVEHRSDGTLAVTLEGAWEGGVAASAGAPRAKVKLKGINLSAGGEVTASLLARLGDGRTWIVGSEAEAAALIEAGGGARSPDVTYGDRAWLSTLSGTLGLDTPKSEPLKVGGQVAFDQHWGTSTDHRTGHRVTSIHASWSGEVDVLGLQGGDDGPVIAIEADAAGRPLDLRITTSGALLGSRDLPGVVQPVAGLLEKGSAKGRRYEVTAHLDLTDPVSLAAARGLIAAIDAKHARVKPDARLRQLLDERGTIEARVLTERTTQGKGQEVSFGLGGQTVGFDRGSERSERQLLAAASRGLDGQWVTRTDCVA